MLMTISYDGTNYHGWQVQPNGITVQQTVQNAMTSLLGYRPDLTGCSRTDAGVHARCFCCHFDCNDKIPESAFIKGLDSLLPNDISVIDCNRVDNNFHARYNAVGKTYNYYIYNSRTSNPFYSRYSWKISRKLDVDIMNQFCSTLKGKHDFTAFSSSGRTTDDTVRTVTECNVKKKENMVIMTITSNGFLYNMVRIIMGTAVAVSDGRIGPEDALSIIDSKDRSLAGPTAPPNGLFLEKVIY